MTRAHPRIWMIPIGTVLIVLTLLAATLFRHDIFQTLQDPGQPFQTAEKPPAPDYAQSSAWMARPDLAVDPATLDTSGDVFIVVPEVYKGSESWNLPIDDPRRVEKLQTIVRPNYVAPYAAAGRLFAPYYRQAALYAFLNNRDDSKKAQDLAYSDVARAFEVFLAASPPERPLVIAGHGQGAAHAQRLLADYGATIADKLAVAYIIDHPFPLSGLGTLPACDGPTDTQCVVAWTTTTERENRRPKRLRQNALVWSGDRHVEVAGKPLLCTNPLLWKPSDALADASLHKGGVGAVGFEPGRRPTVHPQQVSAQCVDGLLRISKPEVASLRRPRRFGGAFRTLPSNLFYEDLRINAAARVEALIAKNVLPRRAEPLAPLDTEVVDVAPVVVED